MTRPDQPDGSRDLREKQARGTMLPPAVGGSGEGNIHGDLKPSAGASSKPAAGLPSGSGTKGTPPQAGRGTMLAPALSETAPKDSENSVGGQESSGLYAHDTGRLATQTHRAGVAEQNLLSNILRTRVNQKKDVQRATGIKPQKRAIQHAAVKSSWNLRIHKRGVNGELSGICNEIPRDVPESFGLASALIQGEATAEYDVLGELGAGNMGVVYRAIQTSLNRELAIKTLRSDIRDPLHDQEMFVSEAVVTANLVHPNIVPIHDLGRTEDGKLFYSMKQVNGISWVTVMKRKSLEENLDILMKVCDAVAYAHSRGVINRDLKPENVVVGDFGEVIVLDWGLAITTPEFEKRNSVLIDYRGCAGTPAYMSPELAEDDVSLVCPQSDVYLLGAILFEVLEGFPPHLLKSLQNIRDPDHQFAAVVEAVVNNEIEEDVVNTGELMQIARRAMATFPHERYSSVEEFQEAIREYRITGRAEELLEKALDRRNSDYDEFQQSVALFSDALRKWPENRRALRGDKTAREAFARLALKKGDLDLGLEIVAGRDDDDLVVITSRLKKSRRFRSLIKVTWLLLFTAAVVFMVWNIRERREAELARQKAEESRLALVKASGDLDEQTEKARIAKEEAAIATRNAEQQRATAEELKKNAELLSLEIDKEREKVNTAKMEAMKAAMEADAAKLDADTAKATALEERTKAEMAAGEAQLALKQADAAEMRVNELKKAAELQEIELVKGRIDVAYELRQYSEVVRLGKEALEKLKENSQFDRQQQQAIEQKINNAERSGGNVQLQLEMLPLSSAMSSDGQTIAVAYNSTSDRPRRIEFLRRKNDGLSSQDLDRQEIKLPGGRLDELFVSPKGAVVAAAGLNLLWKRNAAAEYASFTLATAGERLPSFSHCLFSNDEKHLYLVENDRACTIYIYEIGDENLRLLLKRSLYGDSGSFVCQDIVLLSDESCLVSVPKGEDDSACRAFYLNWSDGVPAISAIGGRAPELKGIQSLSVATERSRINLLELSPDGMTLLAGIDHGGKHSIVMIPKRKSADHDDFPFESVDETTITFQCVSETLPSEIVFSADGTRIAGSILNSKRNNIQIWDVVAGKVTDCRQVGLLKLAEGNGTLLSGVAGNVLSLAFDRSSSGTLICVSKEDSRISKWDLSTYSAFVQSLQEVRDSFRALGNQQTSEIQKTGPRNLSLSSVSGRTSSRERLDDSRKDILRYGDPIPAVAPLQESDQTSGKMGNRVREIDQKAEVFSAEFSQDGERVLVGADDLAAHVYSSETGNRTLSMVGRIDWLLGSDAPNYFVEGHNSNIKSVRFLPPNGDLLLTSENLGVISVWDATPDEDGVGQERSRLLPRFSASDFAVSDDGKWVLAGGAEINSDPNAGQFDKLLHQGMLWDVSQIRNSLSPEPVRTLTGQHPKFEITAVSISPGSTRAVTCGRRGRIVVWSIPDGQVIATVDGSHDADAISGAFFLNEEQFATAGNDGKVLRWTLENGKLRSEKLYQGIWIVRMEASPDRTRMAIHDVNIDRKSGGVGDTLRVRVIDLQGNTLSELLNRKIPESDKGLPARTGCTWSPDGATLLLVIDGEINVYETTGWKLMSHYRVNHPTTRPIRAALSPPDENGNVRLATSSGRLANLWDLSDRSHLSTFRTHHSDRITASFSSDRRFVLTASDTLRVFDAEESSPLRGRTIFRLGLKADHEHPLVGATFSPVEGDYRFISFDRMGELRLWQWERGQGPPSQPAVKLAATGQQLKSWMEDNGIEHLETVGRWSQDGRLIGVVRNGSCECWKVDGNQLVAVPLPLSEDVEYLFNDASFSRTGNFLVAGGVGFQKNDGQVYSAAVVWRITPEGGAEVVASLLDIDRQHSEAASVSRHAGGVSSVWLDEQTSTVLTGGEDARINLWKLPDVATAQNGTFVWTVRLEDSVLPPHSGRITGLGVSSTRRVLSSDNRGFMRIWSPGVLE
ncbi:MAG: protein kinase [Planctomyces sp.]|nr:protein kinase [Planctomyces sp.]